jgi:hypothetical protein
MDPLKTPIADAEPEQPEVSSPTAKKKDNRFIRLQVVENEIKEYNILKWYLSGMMVTSDLIKIFLLMKGLSNFDRLLCVLD